jgi:hypothetical protein
MADRPSLPVLFRTFRGELCAYFPTERATPDGLITCFAEIGGHGGANPVWLRRGRPAKPDQYADLLAVLRRIYETGDAEHIDLRVVKRAPPRYREGRANG